MTSGPTTSATGFSSAGPSFSRLFEFFSQAVYAFFRRAGHTPENSEGWTHVVFMFLQDGTPAGSGLRTAALQCAKNCLNGTVDPTSFRNRSPVLTTFDASEAEAAYALEPPDLTSEKLFQRRWTICLLGIALQALRKEISANSAPGTFELLSPFLGYGADMETRYEETSSQLGIPVATLEAQVFRLRIRWREILLEHTSRTVSRPTQASIADEMAELLYSV